MPTVNPNRIISRYFDGYYNIVNTKLPYLYISPFHIINNPNI